jgi:transcriptional regulator with XRE-family HTH domain
MNKAKKKLSWDEEVRERLQKSPKAVAAYMTGLCEADQDLSAEEALRLTILAIGEKTFCEISGANQSTTSTFVNGKRKPRVTTLNKLLKAFGLKTELALKN